MYRVSKVLNHNGMIAVDMKDNRELLFLGKGVGFGKKVSERFEVPADCTVYELNQKTDRGSAKELATHIAPEYLELADGLLNRAEQEFGRIDRAILFPMADHIAFAVERIRKGEPFHNPLTDDIKVLFEREYRLALTIRPLVAQQLQVELDDDEIGYVALHVHSAIMDEKVSVAMQMAGAVRECVELIEQQKGKTIRVESLAYNRLMNHIKYMVARVLKHEDLKLDMNDYMEVRYPDSFMIATTVCDHLSQSLHEQLKEVEIGYLAMHIERVYSEELQG